MSKIQKTRVAINGFGRIGRQVARIILENNRNIEIVAANDLMDVDLLAHLFEYDSNFGKYLGDVSTKGKDVIVVDGHEIKIFAERDPQDLPWKDLKIDIVIESTGFFRTKELAQKHVEAGAKRVIISAPASNEDITVVLGVNHEDLSADHKIISNASCTTNCLAPIAKVLHDNFEIVKASMTTVHSYTMDQKLQDAPHSDLRRSRSAAQSIIPTTTGAAKAVGKVLPDLKGKIDGFAMRVPTPTVSIVDLTAQVSKKVSVDDVNKAFRKAASKGDLSAYLGVCELPLVSIDFKKNPLSSVVDLLSTMVVDDNLVKVVSWYDNEWGYSNRVVDLVDYISINVAK